MRESMQKRTTPAFEKKSIASERDKLSLLTRREREVLAFVSQGDQSKEVAEKLGMSPRTVTSHLQAIYRKFQVKTRTAATRIFLEQSGEHMRDGHGQQLAHSTPAQTEREHWRGQDIGRGV